MWRACLFLVLVAALCLRATAQDRPTFSAESQLVVLHVTVEDRRGTYISGLPQDAFTVFEDGRRQELRFFSAADTPATIGLLIDNSTSMMSKRDRVVAATLAFAELSNPEDEVFVLAFNEDVSEIWAPRLIADSNLASMRAVLTGGVSARGRTALYDALARGLEKLEAGRHTRQVLVVISDGGDNASTTTLDEVLARTRGSDAAIFTVALRDPVSRDDNPSLLKRMARETGGEPFQPDQIDDVPETLRHIARDIRSAYTLSYEPEKRTGPETLRKLRVTVRTGDGRMLTGRTRGGYIARARVDGTR